MEFDQVTFEVQKELDRRVIESLERRELWADDICALDTWKMVQEAMIVEIEKILENKTLVTKIIREALKKHEVNERKHKAEEKQGKKVWAKTKGIIPCANRCGHTQQIEKRKVISGRGLYICKECSDKMSGSEAIDIFEKITIEELVGL